MRKNIRQIKQGLRNFSKQDLEIQLCDAIKDKNLHQVETLLMQGANPDFLDRRTEDTLLKTAIKSGSYDIVKALIDAGADVNQYSLWGREKMFHPIDTAISGVRERGEDGYRILELLLDNGGDVNAPTPCPGGHVKVTPIYWAAHHHNTRAIDILVKHGANISEGLRGAVYNGDIETIDYLLDNGADIEFVDVEGYTPLLFAVSEGKIGKAKHLVERGANIYAECPEGNAVDIAINRCLPKTKKFFRSLGLQKTDKTPKRMNRLDRELFRMIYSLRTREVENLLEEGANPNATDKDGNTAIMAAGWNTEMVSLLLAYGADINARKGGPDGETVLTRELTGKSYEGYDPQYISPAFIQFLINHGADVNVKVGRGGITPIQRAVVTCGSDVVLALLKAGADPTVKTQDGWTILMSVAGRSGGYMKLMEILIEAGVDVNAQTDSGETALLMASKGYTPNVKLLLDYGANPNVKDKDNHTPLSIAASMGKLDNVKALVEAGADIYERGSSNDLMDSTIALPIELAEKNGHSKVVSYLEQVEATFGRSRRRPIRRPRR